ncbi:MAG TPA: OmpA family protein, partial [Brevundimonas sp.]|nr:OmpA family protein [Brevundimonas sp.]
TANAEAQATADAQAQAGAEAAAEAQATTDAEALARAEAEANAEATAEADAQATATAEANARATAEADAEATARAEAEAQATADAQAAALAVAEAEARARAEAEAEAAASASAEVQAQARADAEARARAVAAANADASAALQAAAIAEAQAMARAEAQAEAEANAQAQAAAAAQANAQATADTSAAATAQASNQNSVNITNEVIVNVETITAANVRGATEDFETDVSGQDRGTANNDDDDDDEGLSDLERVLLLSLGATAVGSLLDNGQEVVSNSGDRVVTLLQSGEYEVYRNDDAILRQPGAEVRTETFADGSARTFLTREDGTQVVTIRSATGQVLRRSRVLPDGTQIQLFNDLEETTPVNVVTLLEQAPPPVVVSTQDLDVSALRVLLQEEPAYDPGRDFSLRQVREISAVRNLVTSVDLEITFPSGSAAIPGDQLSQLVEIGILIEDTLAENPAEVFLIEGHTDAVGSEAANLALSDRRAESVALALTENFDIPPENLVIQGYGEQFLRVRTEAANTENRRASVRRITPLLGEDFAALQ